MHQGNGKHTRRIRSVSCVQYAEGSAADSDTAEQGRRTLAKHIVQLDLVRLDFGRTERLERRAGRRLLLCGVVLCGRRQRGAGAFGRRVHRWRRFEKAGKRSKLSQAAEAEEDQDNGRRTIAAMAARGQTQTSPYVSADFRTLLGCCSLDTQRVAAALRSSLPVRAVMQPSAHVRPLALELIASFPQLRVRWIT